MKTYSNNASADKSDNHSNHVNSELELKKFRYAIVYIATPHDSLYDRWKIIIR